MFEGFVQFDLGNVHVPGRGSFHVKGEYPRLKPRFEREHVDEIDLKALSANLMVWIKENFETNGKEKYFEELALSCVLLVVYTNTIPELYSDDVHLSFKFFFWLWYADDLIENAIENKIERAALKLATDQIRSILTGKYDNSSTIKFQDVPNYPIFGNLFHTLLQLHNVCRVRLPEYEIRVKNFSNDLNRFFAGHRLFNAGRIDGRYSEESFKTYRKTVAFVYGTAKRYRIDQWYTNIGRNIEQCNNE